MEEKLQYSQTVEIKLHTSKPLIGPWRTEKGNILKQIKIKTQQQQKSKISQSRKFRGTNTTINKKEELKNKST